MVFRHSRFQIILSDSPVPATAYPTTSDIDDLQVMLLNGIAEGRVEFFTIVSILCKTFYLRI